MSAYKALLDLYPNEDWRGETDTEDGYCATCLNGTPCRGRIENDVTDLQSELRHENRFPTPADLLAWLSRTGYSSLTHSIGQLADCYLADHPTVSTVIDTYRDTLNCEWPVTLIQYRSGDSDVHLQTGPHHADTLARARTILAQRGLQVDENRAWVAASGIYYPLRPVAQGTAGNESITE